jgi:phosphohistidine phosphatase SixA
LPAADALVVRLRAGGLILYFRHAITDQSRQDDANPDLNDRTTQRNLSGRGRQQATGIGTAIRALAIPIGDVLASPYARTVETGELAFGSGRVRASRDLLNEAYPGTDDADLARRLRRLLGQRPPAGQNTVLIGHGFNITEATGITIAEGECAVFEPAGEGDFRLVARVTAQRWPELARPR